jgi:hypothetical protein
MLAREVLDLLVVGADLGLDLIAGQDALTVATGLGARPAHPTTNSVSAMQPVKCFMGGTSR